MAAPMDRLNNLGLENSDINESLSKQNQEICSLCLKESSRYTCPRCNVRYCSLACYRSEKHGGCSEAFYHDCVVEDLADTAASSDDQKQVMDILERQKVVAQEEEEELNEVEDQIDLEERLYGLDLDGDSAEIWNRLTEKERNEFNQMLEDGRLANLVTVWTPWWNVQNKEMVLEVDVEEKLLPGQPPIVENLPDITKLLTKSHPSSDIRYNMVNVLYSYAFVCRLHNGGHVDCPTDAVQDLLAVCRVLDQTVVCTSVGEALQMCLNNVQTSCTRWNVTSEFMLSVIADVKKLISGPHKILPLNFMLSALSDIIHLLKTAHTAIQTDSKCSSSKYKYNKKVLKKRIFHADKKSRFLLSWCQRYGMAVQELVPEITLEMEMRLSDVSDVTKTKQQLEEQWGGVKPKPKTQLIQEIG
ncbi:zinc finger HIT domain-containing protein 2-like [Gigantopelta aegis]|uniref:zinc finger HIT domain-containing protein 2-like n=1 Tax=Gigantopelta aegis TaxID=1735272 RepID=UPI001B88CF8C|nr:zinc finger HIT domain-containing protein 2-like [Gigantopelta aegis]